MENILTLKHVTKSFGGVRAVDDLSVDFEAGQITAFIGTNGAGKTTAFNIIGGMLQPDTGSVLFKGKSLLGLTAWDIASLGIGRLFQDARLFRKMTVLENLMAAFQNQHGEAVWRSMFIPFAETAAEKQRKEAAMQLLEKVGLQNEAETLAESLSFGQQKLAAIARLLAADAKLLLLDEPTAGVNPAMIKQLLEIVQKLMVEGRTVIFVEHNLEVIRSLAHRVVFMNVGKIMATGTPQEVLNDPQVRSTYIGR
ncbi:MAG: ATP-binding cassette domain-containing protein [Planctomycetaceae bacterium]|jgi:ABC-type branched-subunit amino acid transport system ATPase component|nr:ATP-binding cassette domain-containing protein [Planctomycetaceae bacterium]